MSDKKKTPEATDAVEKTESIDAVTSAKKKRNAKVIKHTTMATVLTVIFIAAVVLINIIASILFDRYPLTIDLTENAMYSITQESIDYIQSIDGEINVTVLANEDTFSGLSEYTLQAMELLKRYQEYNPNIKVSYVDLLSHPEIASNYTNVDLQDYDIIFELKNASSSGDSFQRVKVLKLTDLVSWNAEFTSWLTQSGATLNDLNSYYGAATVMAAYSGYIVGSDAEAAFTSAIMTITDPDPISVAFLTGHNEVSEFAYFRQLLSANGYQLIDVDIMTEDIPSETDLIVIPAPAQDYMDEEIKKVSDFLLNDGKLEKDALYIASVEQGETPNLDEFLEEYGIKVENTLILENDKSRYYNYGDVRVPSYALPYIVSDNYMQDMNTADYLLLMPNARPVTQLYEEQGMSITTAYTQSSSMAYTCGYDSDGFNSNNIIERGTQTSLVIASKAAFSDDDVLYSNLMVIGSDEFLADRWLQEVSFQNSEYIISLLNGMTGKTDTGIVIATKTILGRTFDITEKQASILKWIFQLIIPLVVLVINFIVYKLRKNK